MAKLEYSCQPSGIGCLYFSSTGDETILTFIIALAFVYGAVFSSFGNLVAERVPVGKSILRPRSSCNVCGHRLHIADLVPILSWLWLHGRCRYCGHRVSFRYPLFEFVGGCLWAATYIAPHNWQALLVWWLFWLFLVIVIQTDLLYMRVPNILTLPGTLVFLALGTLLGVTTLRFALLGLLVNVGMLLLLVVVSGGKMGMGDLKLYGVIGVILGPWLGIFSLVAASFSASIVGLSLRAVGLLRPRQTIPFVPHIAVGVVISVFFGPAIWHWYLHTLLIK